MIFEADTSYGPKISLFGMMTDERPTAAWLAGMFGVYAADDAANNTYIMAVRNAEASAGLNYGLVVRAGLNSSDQSFLVEKADGTDYFVVRGDGNVGIGTASPSVALDVVGSAKIDTSTFVVDSANDRVGILVASPSVTLDVAGAANFLSGGTTNEVKVGRNANEYLSIIVNDGGVILESVQDENDSTNGYMAYRVDDDGTSTARHLFQKKSGAYADVEAAGFFLRNWTDNAGNGYACASVDASADGFIYYKTTAACGTSSIRFKEQVRPLDMTGAEAVLHLTPVTYMLKAQPGAGFQFGAIAEQAAGLGLEWLVERDADGQPRTLLYDRISLYLIPVIRAQQERITVLEQQINTLGQRLATLEVR